MTLPMHSQELLDQMYLSAAKNGKKGKARAEFIKDLTEAATRPLEEIDPAVLERLASAICPISPLPAAELVAHVYRVALDVTAARRTCRLPYYVKRYEEETDG